MSSSNLSDINVAAFGVFNREFTQLSWPAEYESLSNA
jgi:hypothetical protein